MDPLSFRLLGAAGTRNYVRSSFSQLTFITTRTSTQDLRFWPKRSSIWANYFSHWAISREDIKRDLHSHIASRILWHLDQTWSPTLTLYIVWLRLHCNSGTWGRIESYMDIIISFQVFSHCSISWFLLVGPRLISDSRARSSWGITETDQLVFHSITLYSTWTDDSKIAQW